MENFVKKVRINVSNISNKALAESSLNTFEECSDKLIGNQTGSFDGGLKLASENSLYRALWD